MKDLLTARLVVGAAGWMAFSTAAWFTGDLLALGGWRPLDAPAARVALIALLFASWIGWEFLRAHKEMKANARLLEGLAEGGAAPDSAERAAQELTVLRKRFEDALVVLRKARFRGADGERRTVSELPWYMFIGAPGSGKTTALLNAGLRFPLGDPATGNVVQGVGGTRNCDWLFTDEAVLLDTAGRYTTQESDHDADAAAWLGFLDLLKRFRPRRPLNGAIVTVSISDLVHWTEEELQRYGGHVRERIWELYTRFGVRLPIYLMVTKTDLLAGFSETFSEFDAAARAQVWGATFDHTELVQGGGVAARFDEEFARLERRLYAALPARLQEERDLQRRAAIYRFPQQLHGVRPMLASFLDAAFGSGWSGEPPFLRGIYFTSGTQEGSPIDRVLGTLARTFNLERKVQPPNIGSGKSYFLRRLLRDVIFGESGLAGANPAEERVQRTARRLAHAAIAGLTALVALAWTVSFIGNRNLIAAAAAAAGEARREIEALPVVRAGQERQLLSALGRLRALARPTDSWTRRFGLYQGDKIAAQAERAYRGLLRESLVPHLAASMEQSLRSRPTREVVDGYVALHGAGEAEVVGRAAQRLWSLPQDAEVEMAAHLRVALAEQPLSLPRARDDTLLESARRRLGGRS